jgi:hypothetical protein
MGLRNKELEADQDHDRKRDGEDEVLLFHWDALGAGRCRQP